MKIRIRLTAVLLCLLIMLDSLMVIGTADGADGSGTENLINGKWNGEIASEFGGGSGSAGDPYLITNGAELAYLSYCVKEGNRFDKKYFLQTNDIDLSGIVWTPIGTESNEFLGIYNGAGHSVANLNVNGGDYCGLFGICGNSSNAISDLTILSATVIGKNYVGAVAGYVSGTVDNCVIASVNVIGNENVGGMIGRGSTIQNSNSVLTQVQGINCVGGVVGTASHVISCSSISVYVNGEKKVGGIAGSSPFGEIRNCVNYGFLKKENQEYDVIGNECVGGVVGDSSSVTVSQCINFTDVYGSKNVGGILGYCNSYGKVTENYSTGNIYGENYVGGVVGQLYAGGTVEDCYNTGNVRGSNKGTTGGVLGNLWDNGPIIRRNYNFGDVANGGKVYGTNMMLGLYYMLGMITASSNYYLSNGEASSHGTSWGDEYEVANPLTVFEFMSKSNFSGWDFNKVWIMSEKLGRPVLRNASVSEEAMCRIVIMDGATGEVIENASISQIAIIDDDSGKPIEDQLASCLITGEKGIFNISKMLKWFSYDYEIVITADGYEDFMCYLTDLEISTGRNVTNIAPMWKTGDQTPSVIAQGEHADYIINRYDAFVDDNGFVEQYWSGINESTVAASRVWEVLGDIKDIVALNPFGWNNLLIFEDYYDTFIMEYLLSVSGTKSFEQLCKEEFSTQFPTDVSAKKYYKAYQSYKSNFKEKIVDNIAAVINDPELREKEWITIFDGAYGNTFAEILKKKFEDPVNLKQDLYSLLDKPWELTGDELDAYNQLLKWSVSEKSTKQLLKEFAGETIEPVMNGYKEAKDVVNDIISCCSIAEVCVEANEDVFKVLYETCDELAKTNSKYAKWFKEDLDKYHKIATDKTALKRFLIKNILLSISESTWNITFQKAFTEWTYSTIATKFNITIPQMKAVVAVYTGTYSILDNLTKLGDKDKLILLMNYVAPLESAMENVVRNYGTGFLADMSQIKMDEYCFAHGCLKQLNLYLYESAIDVTQLAKDTSLFSKDEADAKLLELAKLKLEWEESSCHANILENRYKYIIRITEQPEDIDYVLHANSYDGNVPESYLWLKGKYTGNSDTDVQPAIKWLFDNSNGILEIGKTYTAFATAKFDEGSTGTVFCNVYVYNDYKAAVASDWSHLMNFSDFVSCAVDNGGWQWTDFEKSWDFSKKDYKDGTNVKDGDAIAAVTVGIGFWQASGGISISEIGIKSENGEVIWSKTFENGLNLCAEDIVSSYLTPKDIDNSWGFFGGDIIVESGEYSFVDSSKNCVSIKASGNNLSYQWEYSLDGGFTWYEFSGKDTASCYLNPIDELGAYVFRCRVTNPYGVTAYSNTARLKCLAALGDYQLRSNGDGTCTVEKANTRQITEIPSIGVNYENVTVIGERAFNISRAVLKIIVPYGITTIESRAFERCTALESITIPESVTKISEDAFRDCQRVTIYCYEDSAAHQYASENGIPYVLIDGCAHIWDDGVVTKEANCTENGMIEYTCAECGKTKTKTILPLEHEYTVEMIEPSCMGPGYTAHVCSRCGDRYTDEFVNPNGHTETMSSAIEPTCTASGKQEGIYCSVCGEDLDTLHEIPPLGHDYIAEVTDPTCTEQGYTTHTCSRCGDAYTDTYVSAVNHKYENACDTDCNVCGHTRTVTHDYGGYLSDESGHWRVCALCGAKENIRSHTFATTVIPATCTEQGYTVYKCTVCDYSYNGDYVQALGHTGGKATCIEEAICTRCGEHYGELGAHDYSDEWKHNADGHWHECICGDSTSVEPHVWDKGTVTKEPTTTSEGTVVYKCVECGNERSEIIEMLKYIRGDVDANGKVNSADAVYLLRHTMRSTKYPIDQSGDMNGDDKVNSADAVYLLRYTMRPSKYPLFD